MLTMYIVFYTIKNSNLFQHHGLDVIQKPCTEQARVKILFIGKDVAYRNLAHLSKISFLEGNLRKIKDLFIFLRVKDSYELSYFSLLKEGPSDAEADREKKRKQNLPTAFKNSI